jgi:2-iminobutanoate/2-iminopropanoate deaminase
MNKTVISSADAPAALGPYSAGIRTGNLVFLSGQLGINPATGELAEGVCAQAEQSLANIETLLNEAGTTTGNVVKTTVFLADIDDFKAVNEVYAKHFEAPFPARSAIQVAAMPAGALVEIEVIASVQ